MMANEHVLLTFKSFGTILHILHSDRYKAISVAQSQGETCYRL